MTSILQNLKDNLRLQADVYAALYEFAQQKQEALISNNLVKLETITLSEEQLLLEVSRLEKERLLLAGQIGFAIGKPPEELTLKELAAYFPELLEIQIRLDDLIKRLINVHEFNTQLLQQALKIVNLTSSLLTQQEGTTYSNPQRKDIVSRSRTHFLDRSV
ncbi:MAG TPA: flagellar protein FlgN [Desulfitobacteriaceae bacterium]|nr:flagellar protein FlgN [Desulfitobacteriaceae bacterium]